MFHAIGKAFKALDRFLTRCEEYTEQRVWNGKFIIDLRFLSITTFDNLSESLHKNTNRIIASPAYIQTRAFLQKIAGLFMQFDLVADTVYLIGDGLRICISFFAHYLSVLIVGLSASYLLLTLFKTAPAHFVVLLLPLLFINHIVLSVFFCQVEKKEQIFNQLKQTLPATLFIFFLQNSLVFIAGVFFVGFAFLISAIFSALSIEWRSSFFYWLPMVMTGLILLVFTYIFQIILSFAYTFVLHEKKSAFQAIQQSYASIHTSPRYSFFFYFLLTLFTGVLILFLSTIAYEGGFVVSMLFMNHAFLLLGFLLRRKYFKKDMPDKGIFITHVSHLSKLLIAVGIFSYISAAALYLQIQPQLIKYIEDLHPTPATSQQYITYQNKNYTINYPVDWSVYRWDDNSLTISTNDTGTITGSVKVEIRAKSLADSEYLMLYEANPGLINYDTGTRNVTTKIANTVVNEHNAVKYTYTKADTPQTEFQTHYLLRNDDTLYDISLITYSKKREAEYMELFETMVKSFTTLQQ